MNTAVEEFVNKMMPPVEASEAVLVPKTKTKTKVAKVDDLLVSMVQEISKMSAAEAIEAVPSLMNGADENYFRLGGVLSVISANKYYEAEGYPNFKEFVEARYGLQYRKAMYWVQIYDKLIESGVHWDVVKDVGWTKLKDLAAVLTPENAEEWVKKAIGSTVLQLQEAIAKAKLGTLANSGITPVEDGDKSKVTTITYKVHADQKTVIEEAVEKAKIEANTDFGGVALEAICMNYLSGGNVGKPPALATVLKKYSPEDALTALEEAFPAFEVTAKLKKGQSH